MRSRPRVRACVRTGAAGLSSATRVGLAYALQEGYQGVVTLDGQPLEEAYVQFHPVGTTRGTGAASNTDAEGRYELIAPDRSKGAPIGEYRVVISKLILPDGTPFKAEDGAGPMDSPGREMLPARFSDYEQSVLTVMVPEGGGKIDLPLVSKR